jgi:hypothetical protein
VTEQDLVSVLGGEGVPGPGASAAQAAIGGGDQCCRGLLDGQWWAIGGLGLSALTVPYGISYGAGDGLGYLLGTLFHFSISDSLSSMLETTLLVVLGLYWITIYFVASRMQRAEQLQKWSWRGIWVLPVALSLDNLTYGGYRHTR